MSEPGLPSPDHTPEIPASASGDVVSPDPTKVQRALEKLADTGKVTRETFMAMAGTMGGNPLHQKMTPEHITQVLTLSEKHDEREFTLSSKQQEIENQRDDRNKKYHLICFILALISFGFTMVLFKDKPDTLKPILTGIGGLVSGFLGGVGYAKSSKKE